ncbi:type IV secretion system protein [Erwinia sp. Ejp617]|nr:ATPase, T2SS/T4P/T4SS family [Erwinia sp. Ejp617]ADP10396.1 type IV secretion system protein [Erwinia sp. Ejp617]
MSGYVYFDESQDRRPGVFFSQDHCHDPETQNALARLLRSMPEAEFQSIPLEELRALQKNGVHSGGKTEANSEQQARVVGFFRSAKRRNASDIHLLIGMNNVCIVQIRIHGELHTIAQLEKDEGMQLASTIIMSMCDVTEKSFNPNRAQDGRIRKEFVQDLNLFGARYAHTPAEFGLYVVMRILPDEGGNPPSLQDLGFLPPQQQLIHRMLSRPEGILIIAGPTGSGKSTSLRSFSELYLTRYGQHKRLLTLEDPPEGLISGAVQTPVIADKSDPLAVDFAWNRSISASLRLDPDAMIIGEIRDTNSLKSALIAAKSGHLVQTTLHANDAPGILARLTDTLDVPVAHIADPQIMIGLIAQRLVQVLCPHCKQHWQEVQSKLTAAQHQLLTRHCQVEKLYFRHKEGCTYCTAGVTGRRVIAEVIGPDVGFMTKYRHEGKLAARHYWITELNGITRRQHLQTYLNEGLVDPLDADVQCPLDEDVLTLSVLNKRPV